MRSTGSTLRRRHIGTIAAVAAGVAALGAAPAAGAQTLIGSGSSAAQPYMLKLFQKYSRIHPGIHFRYNPDGGNAGVSDVQVHRSQFAIQTRPPLPSDSGTTYDKLFLDGLCIDVNSANPLSNMNLATLRSIFLGHSTNWSQVGWSSGGTIAPIGRTPAAGTYTFFSQAVLNGATQSSNVAQKTSDGLVAVAVSQNRAAIGYVGKAHASGSHLKTLRLNGISCTSRNIKRERYPLFRYIWSVIPTSHPSLAVEKFIDWVRRSHAAGVVINNAGAVPAFNKGF